MQTIEDVWAGRSSSIAPHTNDEDDITQKKSLKEMSIERLSNMQERYSTLQDLFPMLTPAEVQSMIPNVVKRAKTPVGSQKLQMNKTRSEATYNDLSKSLSIKPQKQPEISRRATTADMTSGRSG